MCECRSLESGVVRGLLGFEVTMGRKEGFCSGQGNMGVHFVIGSW